MADDLIEETMTLGRSRGEPKMAKSKALSARMLPKSPMFHAPYAMPSRPFPPKAEQPRAEPDCALEGSSLDRIYV